MPFNVGIVGYGLSAKVFHIPFINNNPEFKLRGICQRKASADSNAQKDFPDVEVFNDAGALIDNPEIDVVVLCTPPETHLPLGKRCLESGKHIVVEKPFCPTVAECDELIASAKRHGKLISVFQNRRWDTDFLTVLELLKKGTLGRVLEFETHFDRWNPNVSGTWQLQKTPGHGVAFDLGTHLMDQVVFAFGMPRKITGFTARQRTSGAEGADDACTILLHYDEMLATVKCTALSAEKEQLRFWVRGDKGSFRKLGEDAQEIQLCGGMGVNDTDFGVDSAANFGILSTVGDGDVSEQKYPTVAPKTYAAFYQGLAEALSKGTAAPVTSEDGRNVIRLVELTLESARCGRTLEV